MMLIVDFFLNQNLLREMNDYDDKLVLIATCTLV